MLHKLKKFIGSNSGAFLPMFGAIVTPVLTLALGATVDYSRMNNLQSRMQSASDIALIAATKSIQSKKSKKSKTDLDAMLKKEFEPFFQANIKLAGDHKFTYTPKYNAGENKSAVIVKTQYSPIFMQLLGFDKIEVSVDLSINLKVDEHFYVIDIVMCLDATGSMQSTLNAAVKNANSFNNDLRKELGMIGDKRLKIRVRPMFYRDWEDAKYNKGRSPLDGGTMRIRHNNNSHHVFKYASTFIDLDPYKTSKKATNVQKLKRFLNSVRARGGYDLPEAGATCINQGVRSKWFNPSTKAAAKYFGLADKADDKITVIPVIVFWTDAAISDPAKTRKFIDSTQPGNWYGMKKHVWDNRELINQKNKILVLFGPNPVTGKSKSGYDKAYAYFKRYYPHFSVYWLDYYAKSYKDHPYFNKSGASVGWEKVKDWTGFAYGGSLSSGNKDGAKIIGKKIKERLPDLLRLSS